MVKPQEHRALPETWPRARHRAGLHESSWGRCAEGHIQQLPGLGETHPPGVRSGNEGCLARMVGSAQGRLLLC